VRRVTVTEEYLDEHARTRTTLLRYERQSPDGELERLERPWVLHWYEPDGFERLATEAGMYILDARPLTPDDPHGTWHFRLGRPTLLTAPDVP
jgi:hypothetical protein